MFLRMKIKKFKRLWDKNRNLELIPLLSKISIDFKNIYAIVMNCLNGIYNKRVEFNFKTQEWKAMMELENYALVDAYIENFLSKSSLFFNCNKYLRERFLYSKQEFNEKIENFKQEFKTDDVKACETLFEWMLSNSSCVDYYDTLKTIYEYLTTSRALKNENDILLRAKLEIVLERLRKEIKSAF